MKKSNRKKLEYVNVEHYLIKTSTFTLLEAIVLKMMLKRVEDEKEGFPDSILFLEKVSGIQRQTINKYIKKFEALNMIYSLDGRHFFNTDCEEYLENLLNSDIENEFKINPHKKYYSTYTCYHFGAAKQLDLNEMQFFFLDIHVGLFKKLGYGTSPKEYIKSILNIKHGNYFKVKKELFNKGYLELYGYPDLIKVSDEVVLILEVARKSIRNFT